MKKLNSLILKILAFAITVDVSGAALTNDKAAFRALYKELVEINTTLSVGSCTDAANAMAVHLRSAGIPDGDVNVIVPDKWPKQGNLVAALRGSMPDSEAILLLAHIDVVEANRDDWERDPFKLVEENGYFFGRGTSDDKAMAAIFVDVLVRMSRSGYRPDRTIKLVLTCGEETPNTFNGASYLLEHHRALIEARFAINEGGGGRLDNAGRPIFNAIQAGEKLYQDYRLETVNSGGHSSRPRDDNAIYSLSMALNKISKYSFPIEFNGTTRGYFERLSSIETGQIAEDMKAILSHPPGPEALARMVGNSSYNSVLHTTCVATMLDAGHAPNALPQRASANVNCRIFPGTTQEEIRRQLESVVNDTDVSVSFVDPPESTSPPPPLTREILEPIEKLTEEMWPGIPVVPTMIAGGTDGRFLTPAGIPTYGVSGLFAVPGESNAHGLNEKMRVNSLFDGREFLGRLIRIYAGGK
ncbi:MAG: acetylornithine deacetylase/succinyl-diaminopimelate desuccinylase-like protein [Oceanicoccus sp.]